MLFGRKLTARAPRNVSETRNCNVSDTSARIQWSGNVTYVLGSSGYNFIVITFQIQFSNFLPNFFFLQFYFWRLTNIAMRWISGYRRAGYEKCYFWNVTTCIPVYVHGRFGGTYTAVIFPVKIKSTEQWLLPVAVSMFFWNVGEILSDYKLSHHNFQGEVYRCKNAVRTLYCHIVRVGVWL
jgi:hypothetical protein